MTSRLSLGGFDDHAAAIGYTCIKWAELESQVDETVAILCKMPRRSDVSRTLTTNMDLRKKIQVVATLGFIQKLSDEWFEDIYWLLSTFVDNNIRTRRNRFIHDQWVVGAGGWEKRQEAAKFKKVPHNPVKLATFEQAPVRADEIWQLVTDIQSATIALNLLNLSTGVPSVASQRRSLLPPIPGSPWTAPDHLEDKKQ